MTLTEETGRAYYTWADGDRSSRSGKLDAFHAGWLAAEARIAQARADAYEDAAKMCEQMGLQHLPDQFAAAIRARAYRQTGGIK